MIFLYGFFLVVGVFLARYPIVITRKASKTETILLSVLRVQVFEGFTQLLQILGGIGALISLLLLFREIFFLL